MEDKFVLEHIKELCSQRKWTFYKLAQESQIPYSSLNAMQKNQHVPSMNNLIKICNGFGITLSQFFSGIEVSYNEETKLLNLWSLLDKHSKELVLAYIYGLLHREIPIDKTNNDEREDNKNDL